MRRCKISFLDERSRDGEKQEKIIKAERYGRGNRRGRIIPMYIPYTDPFKKRRFVYAKDLQTLREKRSWT